MKRALQATTSNQLPSPINNESVTNQNVAYENWPESEKREYAKALKMFKKLWKQDRLTNAYNFYGDSNALLKLMELRPSMAENMLQRLIGAVNRKSGGGLYDVGSALVAGLANPKTRDTYLGSFYSVAAWVRLKKTADIIGRCEICSNFFLRGRKDQKCCCKNCNGILRTRRWRDRYSESYKAQRYKQAESKKGPKQ